MTTPVTTELRDIVVSGGTGVAVGDLGTVIRLGAGGTAIVDDPFQHGVQLRSGRGVVVIIVDDVDLIGHVHASVLDVQGRTVRRLGALGATTELWDLATGTYVLHLAREGHSAAARPFVAMP